MSRNWSVEHEEEKVKRHCKYSPREKVEPVLLRMHNERIRPQGSRV